MTKVKNDHIYPSLLLLFSSNMRSIIKFFYIRDLFFPGYYALITSVSPVWSIPSITAPTLYMLLLNLLTCTPLNIIRPSVFYFSFKNTYSNTLPVTILMLHFKESKSHTRGISRGYFYLLSFNLHYRFIQV